MNVQRIQRSALVALAVAGAALVAGAAQAKGPSQAEVTGPGLDHGLVFGGSGVERSGGSSPLGRVTEGAGFFPAAFGQLPNPMLAGRPKGDLGPRYTITYTVPGPSRTAKEITQDLYPYARGGAVTYMPPGQRVFPWQRTRGGWFAAMWTLKPTLVRAGLPVRPPAEGAPGAPTGVWLFAAGGAVVLVLLAAAAAVARRRPRPAPLP
jgi:hypothetical protein